MWTFFVILCTFLSFSGARSFVECIERTWIVSPNDRNIAIPIDDARSIYFEKALIYQEKGLLDYKNHSIDAYWNLRNKYVNNGTYMFTNGTTRQAFLRIHFIVKETSAGTENDVAPATKVVSTQADDKLSENLPGYPWWACMENLIIFIALVALKDCFFGNATLFDFCCCIRRQSSCLLNNIRRRWRNFLAQPCATDNDYKISPGRGDSGNPDTDLIDNDRRDGDDPASDSEEEDRGNFSQMVKD